MATPQQLPPAEDQVLNANRAFYEALRSLNLEEMDVIWLHEDWVKCLHPGWELLLGWERVRKSWKEIFRNTKQMLVVVSRPLAHVAGDAAWVCCVENITSANEDSVSSALIEATNIFIRQNNRWLMVHHHTSLRTVNEPNQLRLQ
jgi:ketosteroid isomerase-like protein